MNVQLVGCSHRATPLEFRERLAFGEAEARDALDHWRELFPDIEAVLLSTCNRVELYVATESGILPTRAEMARFLANRRGLETPAVEKELYHHMERQAIHHLFAVASSLDSMVVGEAQILAQVKQAYRLGVEQETVGPLLDAMFRAAVATARRVATETAIHQRRVSIPSIAVADFARQIFERFDDKHTAVVGAGEMAEETLRYLREEGARQITVVNRHLDRAEQLAGRWNGRAVSWGQLIEVLATADLVISTTAAGEPIVSNEQFDRIARARQGRPMFILDLAVPRDFDPAIGARPDIYLYSIDDLKAACERNRRQRDRELPKALQIVAEETDGFLRDWRHRLARPVIEQLRQGWEKPKEEELRRLFNKLPHLDPQAREEIRRAFDRLVNKLLHPPLASLRDESRRGAPRALLDALVKLFQLKD
jgi:glutamyl-tRNA reductase